MLGLCPSHVNSRKVLAIVILMSLLTWSVVGQASAQNTTPVPNPTLQAGASGDFPQGSPIFGPRSGELAHDPTDDLVATIYTDLVIENFIVEATFLNPYDAEEYDWSHGIFFRDLVATQYRLIFSSAGAWELTYVEDGEFTSLQSGDLFDLATGKDEVNTVRLAVDGANGLFSLNGEVISSLDLSQLGQGGDIGIGTGLYIDSEVAQASTGYQDFTVWSIGFFPTPTPAATPIIAADAAVVGTNRGEIAVGGGEVWEYEGVEGERISFRVFADRPAGRETTTEERIADNLFDTYMIIRDPSGEVIAEIDDNEELPEDDVAITNSFVSITLPVTGTYEVEVRSYADESGGAYNLEIRRVRTFGPQGSATPTPTAEGSRG